MAEPKKHLAGLSQTPDCPFCEDIQETAERIFYECRHWTSYWGSLLPQRNKVQALPPFASICAHAMQDMDPVLAQQWGQIQTMMAHIVHDRMDMSSTDKRQEGSKNVEDVAGIGKGLRERTEPPPTTPGNTGMALCLHC